MVSPDRPFGTVTAPDGVEIAYRVWRAETRPGVVAHKAIVVIPGIGYHGVPYAVVSDFLSGDGYVVVAVDLRGHGRSGGMRGRVPTSAELVVDLDAVIDRVRRDQAPERLYLMGESMGGLVALDYAATSRTRLDGVVFVTPALRVATRQLAYPENVVLLPAALCCRDRPVVNLIGRRLDDASRDPGFKRARREDPLAINRLSVGYLLGLRALMAGWEAKAARVTVPSLILHGRRDRVVDWRGSEALHAALGATEKRLALVEGAWHTLFWDPDTPEVFAEVRRWLSALPPPKG